ncbi:hypothetical protein [Nocardia alba]|uniref:Uncharacterized protein n=1 Tax=Nocardia alba TaxID=225051 RepID=A0A4R1G022_9NOCA|nr:hypothetical protein [Nocardia alba]TCJ99484.1 hypothetical protein DFR71_0464 [Nocardia alba]
MSFRSTIRTAMTSAVLMSAVIVGAAAPATADVAPVQAESSTPDTGSATGSATALLDIITCPFVRTKC